jgi:hypothetical protein
MKLDLRISARNIVQFLTEAVLEKRTKKIGSSFKDLSKEGILCFYL